MTDGLMASTSREMPRLLIVIVNYRTGPLVVACLESLAAEIRAGTPLRAIVVDNASGDTSVETIERSIAESGWSSWASLCVSPTNGGFAAGNNLAIGSVLSCGGTLDLVWFLNPDTVVRPGAVSNVLAFMAEHPEAGIVGTGIETADGERWPIAFRFPTILGEIERGARLEMVSRVLAAQTIPRKMAPQPAQVDWVCGASMIVRGELLEDVGLMDDTYFLYFEETDFCLQAHRAGWQCWYAPQAVVLHIAGQSTGVTGARRVNRRLPAYWFESRRHYFVKNHGRFYAVMADLGWATAHLFWRLRNGVIRRSHNDPPRLLTDFLRHSALFNGTSEGTS